MGSKKRCWLKMGREGARYFFEGGQSILRGGRGMNFFREGCQYFFMGDLFFWLMGKDGGGGQVW